MIKIDCIKKSYNGKKVVDVHNISFEENVHYVLLGANGSGKSTFARLLAGIIRDDNKHLIKIPNKLKVDPQKKYLQIGYLPQKAYMFDMNLVGNISIAYDGKNKNKFDTKVEELIQAFNIGYLRKENAKGYSGGEQQKVALARFLMKDFDIMILDEPTSAMDDKSTILAEKIIKEYMKERTVLLITHEKEQAIRFSNKKIVMDNGKIIQWNS
ncbi:MAG: ATP-binding cassette domain-containing protein [Eubacteriales bacterium]|nr:ATP-binding cassette domain-containing protein [Eubacteriales bacterium]